MKNRKLLNRILTFALAAVLFFALLPAGFSYAEDTGTPEEYIPVKQDAAALYAATGKYLKNKLTPTNATYGAEWSVLSLARSGVKVSYDYYTNLSEYVKEKIKDGERLHKMYASDNAKVILTLTAIGKDASDVAGHDLFGAFSDIDFVKQQGVNGLTWTLLALDCHGYELPEGYVTREQLIDEIVAQQKEDGGFCLGIYVKSDPDITAMTLQSLAPYYGKVEKVTEAVDKALAWLSAKQNAWGAFGSIDGSSSESCAQVLVALTALGIDPDTDERFIKNGWTVVDAISSFGVSGGGFKHVPSNTELNGLATLQSYYALTSYYRVKEGKTSLYDMSDVEVVPALRPKGDVTGDGEVSADDLTVVSRHVAQIEPLKGNAVLRAADVTKDGGVSADDLTVLSRYVAQIITTLDNE